MPGDTTFSIEASEVPRLTVRRQDGEGEFTILNLPQDELIPELLALVKQLYVGSKGKSDQKANEDAIEGAITAWIEEIKEEQVAKERFARIQDRFQSRWRGW